MELFNATITELRETILTEIGTVLANLTDEINALKQKQNDVKEKHGQMLDVLWISFLEKYATYAGSIHNKRLYQLAQQSLDTISPSQFAEFKLHMTNRLQDALSLKLHPIDGNLIKV